MKNKGIIIRLAIPKVETCALSSSCFALSKYASVLDIACSLTTPNKENILKGNCVLPMIKEHNIAIKIYLESIFLLKKRYIENKSAEV